MTVKSELQERKAGENVDDTQWQDTFQLEKADEEFFSGTRVRNSLTGPCGSVCGS